MEDIVHQGLSPYHQDPHYQVFRNVRDFGAVGDGVHDDTAAINAAISFGVRCAPFVCNQSTTAPATVYFPSGTYLINSSIIDFYYTMLIGDPTDLPVIKATSTFDLEHNLGLIDGNPYGAKGLAWGATNVFFRQISNFVFDTTAIAADKAALGIHWPSSQATSITNCVFLLAEGAGSNHRGLFIEEGSGGLLNDLTFYGGKYAADLGNQQYTARNLKFYNSQVAIHQLWDWGWTYKSIHIENCDIGIQIADNNTASVTLLDSVFKNVRTAITTIRNPGVSVPPAAGTLVMYNVFFLLVGEVLTGPQGVIIPGGTDVAFSHRGFAMGHVYSPFGPLDYVGSEPALFPAPPRALLTADGQKYYERSKPLYEDEPVERFVSARSFGAKGNGHTDDTEALNELFKYTTDNDLIAFVDAGVYYVTDTVHIPPGARIVGEALASVIIGGGKKFSHITKPHPVVQVGRPGDEGCIEWSDMILSTRGYAPGAKILEYNLYAPEHRKVSGMWDVHIRVGGFAGTEHQLKQCPKTPEKEGVVIKECIASWMSMHITKTAAGLMMENCWVWVADHDLEDPEYRQINVFAGRGVLVESKSGRLWFSASSSEHHVLYQYLMHDTKNIYMGQIQTESPYFQPNPPATIPFPVVKRYHDPDFELDCKHADPKAVAPCAMAWGLRITNSHNILIYGAGLYSFFNNYSTDCCQKGAGARCQQRIFDIRDTKHGESNSTNIEVYNLNVVGTRAMVTRLGDDIASYDDNIAGFTAGIGVYKH
ncbi:glucan 1,3-beta-glucosidase, partial [Plectosphaerella plurivora]